MAKLPTNYQDDILSGSMEGKRQYNMIQNANGTVSFEDVTDYSQEGSLFGASQMNNTNREVNAINDNNLDTIEAIVANTDNGKFAGANAVKQLNSNSGGCVFITEGSGANTKYFIQKGADSASKKPLGSARKILLLTREGGYNSLGEGITYDAKTKFPNDYKNFKAEDFIIEYRGHAISSGGWCMRMFPSQSYNKDTGILTISNPKGQYYQGVTDYRLFYKLWLIPNVEVDETTYVG